MPFQKGPCGEGKAVLGFLLPLVEVVVDALVLFIFFLDERDERERMILKNEGWMRKKREKTPLNRRKFQYGERSNIIAGTLVCNKT